MRLANIVIVAMGVPALAVSGWWSWRWRHLAVRPPALSEASFGDRTLEALRALGVAASAGAVSGLLVLGLGGRLVMRATAAFSGDDAQGRLTEADEIVGSITVGGTIGFIVFVGLAGGFLAAAGYAIFGWLLPHRAGWAGLAIAALLLGIVGVRDPIAPDNRDFAVLEPTWLVLVLVAGTGVLFATTFAAVAARLTQTAARPDRRRWLPVVGLVPVAVPPLTFAFAYAPLRAAVAPALAGRGQALQRVGAAALLVAAAFTTVVAARAMVDIVT